ncbi:MAG: hypothetical protein RMZ41_013700 [Nostoc sp. DedVER02]|uniref:hypothetical protein n=1 Tax=unclassified Nostoc TaxID=2593658 RepID=UPI002AD57C00|nr:MULTISPECIES: hypothetical protein [unclassified Nostoc]MDZ7989614.1 hypothetical protein [Nostoc sp. DedVER02]MDZ8113690.1 hypothetical protein [Nostoc sp. DedVER01b]
MILTILKPKIATFIAYAFVVIAFFLGFGLNSALDYFFEPKTEVGKGKIEQQYTIDRNKIIYGVFSAIALSFISWNVVSSVVEASIKSDSEELKNKEMPDKVKEAMSVFKREFPIYITREIENILSELEDKEGYNKLKETIQLRIAERERKFLERYSNSIKVVNHFKDINRGLHLADKTTSETIRQCNIAAIYRDSFRQDIRRCLGWLIISLQHLRNSKYNQEECASIKPSIGNEPYKFALNIIKEELKKVSGENDDTGVVEDYVDRLIKLLSDETPNE